MIAVCPKCEYQWETRAKGELITCPSCHRKFPRPAPVVKRIGTIDAGPFVRGECDSCGREVPATSLTVCRADGETALLCPQCFLKMAGN